MVSKISSIPGVKQLPARTLVVFTPESENDSLLAFARCLSETEPVLFLGVVPIPLGENLSAGAGPARELRRFIQSSVDRVNLRAKARIRVTQTPWESIRVALFENPDINLLVLNWPHQLEALQLTAAEILSHPPCDVAILRGPFPEFPKKILVPNLGDPHAERALRLSLAFPREDGVSITSLHIRQNGQDTEVDTAFSGMRQILEEMTDVEQCTVISEDFSETILETSRSFDLVIMGTKATPTEITTSFGKITDSVLSQSPASVIAVKTKRIVPKTEPTRIGAGAISVLVDRWFAENTFHADEFADLLRLASLKEERGVTISLALPALNEEKTIGNIIRSVQRVLMGRVPLIDEIVLMDSNSTDSTRDIAADLGVPVYIHQEVLPRYGAREGKGEALWKSLYVTHGDIIIWVDTDIVNFHPRFVYGLIGPLLHRTKLMFVKGYYRRPLRTGKGLQPGRGGRVTELTARPLLNLFYPGLSGVIQPLSGEYGGRRRVLEGLPFSSGYGVEIGLLIDMFEKYKLTAIAQVDLLERIHKNQPLSNLSKMSFAIIQTLFHKLEKRYGQSMLEDVNRTMKIVHYKSGHYFLDIEEIAELERPPIVGLPEYFRKHISSGGS